MKDIHESFNARSLSFEAVAKSFVSNSHYDQLSANNHTLLMGPRGSGKTTLLKMLTPACQYFSKKLGKSQTEIPFYAIYIPTDIHWKRQLDQLEIEFDGKRKFIDLVTRTLVTTNIILCVTRTFQQIINYHIDDTTENKLQGEAALATELIGSWELNKPISPTLYSIEQSLLSRTKDINTLIKKIKYSEESDTLFPNYFYSDYSDYIDTACLSFEHVFENKIPLEPKWALCFDELEISPSWLQFELLDKLRSTNQKVLLKLTTSPIVSLVDKLNNKNVRKVDARQAEDFKVIRTWNYNQLGLKGWNEFSEKLTMQKLIQSKMFEGADLTAEDIFGKDSIVKNLRRTFNVDKTYNPDLSHYDKGQIYWKLFKELALIDSSFRKFLDYKNISFADPSPKSTAERDQIFRKILPIATFRYQYIKTTHKRSRKNPALFYGLPYIYELCDGNPRFLINSIDEFLLHLKIHQNFPIEINFQSRIIQSISNNYLSLIKVHPDSTKAFLNKYINLGDLIEVIGTYFFDKLIFGDFSMDPVSSFTVDKAVPSKIQNLIEFGVHLGAFIYLDPQEALSNNGILDKSFRLSYILHPHFNLPKREYGNINLSSILFPRGQKQFNSQILIDL